MEYILSILLGSLALILYHVWNKMRRGHNWPPGPPTVPFLGNVNVDLSDRLKEFRKLRKLYGDVFSLVLGTQTVIVVNGLANLKEFLIKNGDKTSIRPNTTGFKDIAKGKDFQLLRSVNDLFAAGTDTTVNSLSWFTLVLLYKPEIQQRMRKEIEEVVGDSRLPSLADREKLPYCDAVIHETLRFGNIAPFALPHGLTEDMQFNGYFIPKDAVIIPNLDSVLMDPDLFKDPFEFNPLRFLTDDGCLVGTENVQTFGIGRRICLGEALARMELFLFATSLIQRFELVRSDGHKLPELTESKLGTTRSPLPFMVKAVERL
ncbi:hypothetical protein FSP39_016665 [Pinctada imbricata]|uniref:Uncharacterized protein n=1 Tax=Pinctada imbricata TaxID=66713 RepID=A0AA89BW08_PINIB|nr:hypothetical protein FSP39_016665 [Pinctada imbricata]